MSRDKITIEITPPPKTFCSSLTKDQLLLNATFAAEQEALWFHNRSGNSFSLNLPHLLILSRLGLYSAVPRSLGIAAPSNVFNKTFLNSLLSEARSNLQAIATQFSNGNLDLAKGIAMQHSIALDLYQQDKELPLEMNLGEVL